MLPAYDDREILLIAMTRRGAKLACDEEGLEEWLTPSAEPETSW